jgi:hypothetical protein
MIGFPSYTAAEISPPDTTAVVRAGMWKRSRFLIEYLGSPTRMPSRTTR